MIYARCTVCGQTWNVAIGQKIPERRVRLPPLRHLRERTHRHESERQKNSRPPIRKLVGQRITTGISSRGHEIPHGLYSALCKLRDYENTGLSPDEVERLANKEEP